MSARTVVVVLGLAILGCASSATPLEEPVGPSPQVPDVAQVPTGTSTEDTVGVDTASDEFAVAPTPGEEGRDGRSSKVRLRTGREASSGDKQSGAAAGGEPSDDPATPVPGEVEKPKRPICVKPAGLDQVADTSWTVTRGLVSHWQDDPYSLGNVRENGAGWEMIGARQHPAYHLGMRNGDILLEVNGHKLNTMVNLLAAYASCRKDTQFDVLFLRKGKRLTYHYAIKG